VAETVAQRKLAHDRLILGLGGRGAFFRQISFPFSQREKVAQALPFELAPLVPVNLEEMAVDFMPLAHGKGHVLAAALPRELLGRWIKAFETHGLSPDVIGLSPAGPALLAAALPQPMPANLLTVDVGWRSTSVLFLLSGQLLELRTIPLGLADMIRPHTGDTGDPEQALSKLDLNPVGAGSDGDAMPKTREVVAALGKEIAMTGFSLQTRHPGRFGSRRCSAEGGPLSAGWPRPSSCTCRCRCARSRRPVRAARRLPRRRALRRRIGAWDAWPRRPARLQLPQERLRPVPAQGLQGIPASGCSGPGRHPALLVRLARRERRWSSTSGWPRSSSRLESAFAQAVPDVSGSVRPAQYESVLKARITALKGGGQGQPSQPAIDFLLAVSKALEGGLPLTVQDLVIDHESIRLTGTAQAFNTVEEAKNRLSRVEGVQEVRIRGAKADAGGKSISFSLQLLRKGGTPS
jgi:hypothetical protein